MTARSALRRYTLITFLTWLPLGLMLPVMVLLMTERGLSLAQIGLVTTVFSIVTITLELPTGGLADVAGRRVVLAASAAFTLAALTLMAVSTTVWMFLAMAVLKGIGRALASGPATAWYVDTLHGLEGPDADLRPGLARGGATESVALCLGVLAGGFVPLVVPPGGPAPLAVPALAGAVAAGVLLVVALLALPEPAHVREPYERRRRTVRGMARELPATVGDGMRLVAGVPVLRRLMLIAAGSGVALTAVELLTPGRLAELMGAAEEGGMAYAVVAALGFAGSAAGSALAPRVARAAGRVTKGRITKGRITTGRITTGRITTGRIAAGRAVSGPGVVAARGAVPGAVPGAVAGTVLAGLSIGALAATAGLGGAAGLGAAGAAYVLLFAGLGVAGVLCLEMTHHAVGAARRNTVTSIGSLALQAGAAASNLGFGALATGAGTAAAWSVAACLVTASALLFVRMPAPTGSSRAPVPRARSGSG